MTPPGRERRAADRGAVAVEMALSVPMVVLMFFLIIGAFQIARAQISVASAAGAGARAASMARSAVAATAAARASVETNLHGRCAALAVTVATEGFARGGAVTVSVTCTVNVRGLTGVAVPAELDLKATATSPVDVYREAT
ncbi:hypothetical protein Lfu02_75920 [Longispora fulva]|uniref:Flp pilus assembly protein TadG n=1 Tax=Longispora fulva TaxID=619741 RepID=A0A8J7GEK3_9ACTN|nr:TadE/TadG family type IV pilus assembly protein [Longispora fulva]MBG6136271.1 Flp pilus assembly protein TadG [Longispora fulva]GIG63220.1 hypothetical protein Lfu02_75920 [Longispora fulva]